MKTAIKLNDKKLNALKGDNQLKNAVIEDIKSHSEDLQERIYYIEGVLQHGCVSGYVSALIYYADTTKFYQEHKEEIFELAQDMAEEMGQSGAMELFASLNGAKNVGSIDQEENLRAWFGFEETLRQIANELGMEI
jgi:hypothetical protein